MKDFRSWKWKIEKRKTRIGFYLWKCVKVYEEPYSGKPLADW